MKPTSARYWRDGIDDHTTMPSARSAFLQARREKRERTEAQSLGHAKRVKSLFLRTQRSNTGM